MRSIEKIAAGKNYTAASVGKMSEIIEHELPMGLTCCMARCSLGRL